MSVRPELDDFMHIQCFKAAIIGMEDILGEQGTAAALIAAGRKRGITVAQQTGLVGSKAAPETLQATLDKIFGANGTRLCQITEVSGSPESGFLVKTKETVCTSGEAAGSNRKCTYTLGAIMGFLESVYGVTLNGKHAASTLAGSPTDDLQFTKV